MTSCNDNSNQNIFRKYESEDRLDHHSFSNPSEAMVRHLHLDLKADFDNKIIEGSASYDIIQSENASEIILDTRNLDIQSITDQDKNNLKFELKEPVKHLGSALHVQLNPDIEKIIINYKTRPDAAALQWLDKGQTTDKNAPFLFTQGQAILTRTWIPTQDSPGIRFTYSADIEVPGNMLAVMSASNPTEKSTDGKYHFEMVQPIPAYLIAMAVGEIEFAPIGSRTGVFAEPSMLSKAKYEFEDMEKMLIAAEDLYGPYLWDRYDVIVLPASFPFGGMENPRLTFATPTIIAGDKSLTALIAHELAHSWSGNLVTNATWNDFWLNEGFTVYFERRIMEALYGQEYASMLAELGYQDLEHEVESLGHNHKDTHLKLDLTNRNPDDGMTDIAYEKGAYFLRTIANEVGQDNFDKFLNDYFEEHKFETITTTEFLNYLTDYFGSDINLNSDNWVYGPGIPDNIILPDSDKFEKVDQAVKSFLSENVLSQHDWSTHEWLHFIRSLPQDLSFEKMKLLDTAYNFSESGNSEILAAWLQLSIKTDYIENNETKLRSFLINVGRRKFLTPLYKALIENERKELAMDIYQKARPNYHSVSRSTMDDLLGFDGYQENLQ